MSKINEIINREELADSDRKHYDSIVASRGKVGAPYTTLLHSPEITARLAHLLAYCRFESKLPKDLKQLATLAVAREMNCSFEWGAHEQDGLNVGINIDIIEAIKYNKKIDAVYNHEFKVISYVKELLNPPNQPTNENFEYLKDILGISGLIDLTGLIGSYAALACLINAFEILPSDVSKLLPAIPK